MNVRIYEFEKSNLFMIETKKYRRNKWYFKTDSPFNRVFDYKIMKEGNQNFIKHQNKWITGEQMKEILNQSKKQIEELLNKSKKNRKSIIRKH